MATAQQLSAKEVAKDFGTDARTFRKFLREVTPVEDHPGQGGRWVFTKGEANKLRKRFETWSVEGAKAAREKAESNGGTKAKATPAKKGKAAKIEEPEELEEDFEDLEDPDEEELMEDEDDVDLDLDDED